MSEEPRRKRDRTRERIVDRALALFQEHGYEKTTMRAIADACDLSPGAAYYHFKSKEELVFHFYTRTSAEALAHNDDALARTDDFKERFRDILTYKLAQLQPYRGLVGVLAQQATDFQGELSPFSANTKPIRDEAIAVIRAAMDGSNLKVAAPLRPRLPRVLWFYQMGIILFWANDPSDGQRRTQRLVDVSLEIILRLLQATTMPFMKPVTMRAVEVLDLVEGKVQSATAT